MIRDTRRRFWSLVLMGCKNKLFSFKMGDADEDKRIYLRGPRGPMGCRGHTGKHGCRGKRGHKGSRGKTGSVGPVGPTGAGGSTGSMGPTGASGASSAEFVSDSDLNINQGSEETVFGWGASFTFSDFYIVPCGVISTVTSSANKTVYFAIQVSTSTNGIIVFSIYVNNVAITTQTIAIVPGLNTGSFSLTGVTLVPGDIVNWTVSSGGVDGPYELNSINLVMTL
jgi:hypothetical protein